MNTFLKYSNEQKQLDVRGYKIYECKGNKWNHWFVETEDEIVPYIERIFEDGVVYRIIRQLKDRQEGYATIFNKADLEDLRSEIINKQLEKDKILQNDYKFIKK